MMEYHDASMAVGGIHRNDISSTQDQTHGQHQTTMEVEENRKTSARHCLTKAMKFLFSHIGLVALVGAYAVAGGFLFELLEQYQDKLNCQEAKGLFDREISQLKQKIVNYISYNTTDAKSSNSWALSTDRDNSTEAYEKIGQMLYDYRTFVIDTGAEYRFYGDDCRQVNKWTFANSLLFAITIITTIGYGNITPVTSEGRICCICYATIGIPIFLLCLANISGVLGEMFRFLYAKIICAPYNIYKRRKNAAKKMQKAHRNNDNHGWDTNQDQHDGRQIKSAGKRSMQNTMANQTPIDDDEQQGRNQRTSVPLTITMLIIAGYIAGGAFIFHKFEDWTMTQAGYFCFITLATIGFGDFVPGQRKDDSNATAHMILGAIYVLFGMAILAMCFDLMQEEIVAKFRWIGRKMGLIDKENQQAASTPDKNAANNKNPNPGQHQRPTSVDGAARANAMSPMSNQEKIIEDDNENGWPTHRSGINGRKLSPRNNIARVHPMIDSSNEGTLHQRAPSFKQH